MKINYKAIHLTFLYPQVVRYQPKLGVLDRLYLAVGDARARKGFETLL